MSNIQKQFTLSYDDQDYQELYKLNKSAVDPKWKFFKSLWLFPTLKNSELTMKILLTILQNVFLISLYQSTLIYIFLMKIFSYLEVKKRALNTLRCLNSKGFILSNKPQFYNMFIVFNKTESVCRQDYMYDHETEFMGGGEKCKKVQIIGVQIYEDGNYPRGISVTYFQYLRKLIIQNFMQYFTLIYLLDGYKSVVKTYLEKLYEDEDLNIHTLNLKHNESIKCLEYRRTKIIQYIKITTTDNYYCYLSGDYSKFLVPQGCEAHSLIGCMTTGFPFPAMICMAMKIQNQLTGQIEICQNQIDQKTYKNLDLHQHFDVVREIGENFVRIKCLQFFVQNEKIIILQKSILLQLKTIFNYSYARIIENNLELPSNIEKQKFKDKQYLHKYFNENFIDIKVIKGFSISYVKNVSEGKRLSLDIQQQQKLMLCPFEARLNPEWRCNEWYEDAIEENYFFGADKLDKNKLETVSIDLQDQEFITKVTAYFYITCFISNSLKGFQLICNNISKFTGVMNSYISRLDFVTNYGKKYSVGNDYPDFLKDVKVKNIPKSQIPKARLFQMNIPKGSRVVCLAGAFNENFISLNAYYD